VSFAAELDGCVTVAQPSGAEWHTRAERSSGPRQLKATETTSSTSVRRWIIAITVTHGRNLRPHRVRSIEVATGHGSCSAVLIGCHMADEIMQEPSLARQIRDLRKRFGGKQWWLAHAIGCTVAAVSLWESGKRTPQADTLVRIVHALMEAGASSTDVDRLCKSWRKAKLECVLGVEGTDLAPRRGGGAPRHREERKAS
jgi:transcriptional regulator with XRE-family HTH domain